jgi:hypothetical protein
MSNSDQAGRRGARGVAHADTERDADVVDGDVGGEEAAMHTIDGES